MASMCWSVLLVLVLAFIPEEALGRSAAGAQRSLRSPLVQSDGDANQGVGQHDADEEEEDSSDDDAAGPAPAAAPAAVTLAAGPGPTFAAPAAAPGAAPAAAPAAAVAPIVPVAPQAPVGLAPGDGDAPAAQIKAAPATYEMEAEMNEMVDAEKQAMNPQDPLAQLKEQLAAYAWLEDELLAKVAGMSEEVYRGKIAKAEALVAKDTTPGVAKMLGDMRREMHALAAPMYTKVLEEQITEVQAKQKVILAQIAALEAGPTPAPLAVEEPVKQGFPLLYVVLGCVLVLAAVIMIVMLCSRPSRDTDRNY